MVWHSSTCKVPQLVPYEYRGGPLATSATVCHANAVQWRLSQVHRSLLLLLTVKSDSIQQLLLACTVSHWCKCPAHGMAVELFSALDHRGHEVAAVVLDSGGQADGEEVAGHVKAG